MIALDPGEALQEAVGHEGVVAVVAIAELHVVAGADHREDRQAAGVDQTRWQAQLIDLKAEPVIQIVVEGAREAEARVVKQRWLRSGGVADYEVAHPVSLLDAIFRNGLRAGKEGLRRVVVEAIGVATEQRLVVRKRAVDAHVPAVDAIVLSRGGEEVVVLGIGVARQVGSRVVVHQVLTDLAQQVGGDPVVREWVADVAGAVRIGTGAERVVDGDGGARGGACLREVALPLQQRGNGSGGGDGLRRAQELGRDEEEKFVVQDGAVQNAPKLVPLKGRQCPAVELGEVVVRVEGGVARELKQGAVKAVGSALEGSVQDAAEAAAELRRVVLTEDAELVDGVDRGKDAHTGVAVDGRKTTGNAIDQNVGIALAAAVDGVADGVVVVADGAGEARSELDERVGIA